MKLFKLLFIAFTTLCFVNSLLAQETEQHTMIPDSNFEKILRANGFDDNKPLDGKVPTSKIAMVTVLHIENVKINDLTGIQDFTALTDLYCAKNELTTLNLSNNKALVFLDC